MIFEYSSQQLPIGPASEKIVPKLRSLKDIAANAEGYDSPESFVRLPGDSDLLDSALTLADDLRNDALRFVFVIGIGGSSLGVHAVTEALPKSDGVRIIIANAIDDLKQDYFRALAATFESADDFTVVLISKSGETTEAIVNFSLLTEVIGVFEGWEQRVVVITDEESKLMSLARSLGYRTLSLPGAISGRFSIFSPVGVFPLALAGYPVEDIFAGAQEVLENLASDSDAASRMCEDVDRGKNAGLRTLDFFFFDNRFESLGKWARQLWSESLGKSTDREGRPVHMGLLPTVSIATEDLHSVLQLYFGGPRDRMTLFFAPDQSGGIKVPTHPFNELIVGLEGKDTKEIVEAIYGGVRAAYQEHGLSSMEVSPRNYDAKFIGAFMQWQMCIVTALAEAWDINAFDQPNVEDYKRVTREILSGNKTIS